MSKILWYLSVYIIFIVGISIISEWLIINKTPKYVKSYFTESQIDSLLANLKKQLLSIETPIETYSNIYRNDSIDDCLIREADSKLFELEPSRCNQYMTVPDKSYTKTFNVRPVDIYESYYGPIKN